MSPTNMRRTLPALLRLFTLSMRFLLVFFLARLLPVEEVGLYGLILATISFVVFVFGFDFYTYATRQLIRAEDQSKRSMLKSQFALTLVLYGLIGPLLILLFTTEILPWSMALWFLVLVPLEHAGLELDRILIALGDQLGSSLGLFTRQATTTLVVIPLMFCAPALRTVEFVIMMWAAFDALGVAVALLSLRRCLRGNSRGSVDWGWIRNGIRIAAPFLVGTLCLRGLFTFDRQAVALFSDLTTLGAYTLFMTIAAGMTQALNAAVHQFLYPKLVSAAHRHDVRDFKATLRMLALQTSAGAVLMSVAVILAEPFILWFVGEKTYVEFSWILPWAMVTTAVYNLSLVPHYALYAFNADKAILLTTIAAFVVFVFITAALLQFGVVLAVLVGIGSASLLLLTAKGLAYTRVSGRLPS